MPRGRLSLGSPVALERLACALAALACSGPARAQEQAPTLPVFVDGEAQLVEGFKDPDSWVQHDLWVETEFDSDGDGKPDRMHVDVTRPAQTETEGLKVPVVYESSPYFSGTGSTDAEYFWSPRQKLGDTPPVRNPMPSIPHQSLRPVMSRSLVRQWVPRGFAVVHSASPGTGLSQGCPTVGGANESLAPKAVIDWLNQRARGFTSPDGDEQVVAYWCTGKVGMTGTSYDGTLPIAAATTGVEGLEAVVPVSANSSYYHYYRSNGLVRHPGGYMGEDIDVLYDFINSGDPARREYCDCNVRDKAMAEGFDRITGDYNEFWAGRDYLNALEPYRAATLVAHGFNDWNVMPEQAVRLYQALEEKGVPVQAYLHQGGHGGAPPLELTNRWFTRYLYGIANGVESDPRAWIVREDAKRSEPTPYPDYPHPDAAAVRLHPRGDGLGVGGLDLAPAADQGTAMLVDDVSLPGAQLAQAERSIHRLLFATSELAEPVHLSGTPRLAIRLSSSQPAANLSVWLVSLPWTDGEDPNANLVTRGWADPQNHSSLRRGEPLEPGRFYDLRFDLQPDDQVIPAGRRIGLMVFSSDRDFTLWPPPGTELSVDLDATSVELPLVGGAAALRRALGEEPK